MAKSTKVDARAGSKFLVRDVREPGWFWLQNELLDVFTPLIGPYGVLTYAALASAAHGNVPLVKCSVTALQKKTGLGRGTVVRALKQIGDAGLVEVEQAATRTESTVYVLLNLRKLAEHMTVEQRENLALMLSNQKNRPGVPEGNTVAAMKTLLKSSAKGGLEPESSTENPGTGVFPVGTEVFPSEGQVFPVGTLSKEESNTPQESNTSPLPPAGGCNSDPAACASTPHDETPGKTEVIPLRGIAVVRALFTGVMQTVREHLLADSRPPEQRPAGLADGYADWKRYFAELAVEEFEDGDGGLELTLSSLDPRASTEGLVKYSKTWEKAFQNWFHRPATVRVRSRD